MSSSHSIIEGCVVEAFNNCIFDRDIGETILGNRIRSTAMDYYQDLHESFPCKLHPITPLPNGYVWLDKNCRCVMKPDSLLLDMLCMWRPMERDRFVCDMIGDIRKKALEALIKLMQGMPEYLRKKTAADRKNCGYTCCTTTLPQTVYCCCSMLNSKCRFKRASSL